MVDHGVEPRSIPGTDLICAYEIGRRAETGGDWGGGELG